MASTTAITRRQWLLTLAIVVAGAACTFLIWYSTGRVIEQVARSHAEQVHDAAFHHVSNILDRQESLAATLAQSLAYSRSPQQTLTEAGEPLLQRFAELVALERYELTPSDDGAGGWEQVQRLSSSKGGQSSGFQPFDIVYWRPTLQRAVQHAVPGTTPATSADRIAGVPSVHMFWPVPGSPGTGPQQLLGVMLNLDELLAILPKQMPGADLDYRLFDLDSQSTDPIAKAVVVPPMPRRISPQDQFVYENEVSLLDRTWLLRSTFTLFPVAETQGFRQAILVFGAALTLLVALLCLHLMRKARQYEYAGTTARKRWKRESVAGQNAMIEKEVLGRALKDSEQRTRDFIELSNAFSCELDEDWRIGFISSQIAGLLDRTPADLAEHSLLDLLPERERNRVAEVLRACCRGRKTIRIDTKMLQPNGECEVTLTVAPITDGINHCVGYRAVGWRR